MRRCLILSLTAVACSSAGTPSSIHQPPNPPEGGIPVQVWLTTGDQVKLLSHEPNAYLLTDSAVAVPIIDVDAAQQYQEMLGFGAAFTDASAYMIQEKMTATQREALLQDLFGRTNGGGIGLSFMRITMGASDFSLRQYSYDDMPAGQTDLTLAHFSIDADRADKLPLIKRALAINPQITLMASPWSAPGWMKTTGSLIQGTLKPEAYDAFANYFVKFVQAYGAEGVAIRAVTLQNEPHYEPADYPGMRLDPPTRAKVIAEHVGPTFASAGISTQIWDWDHNWDEPQSPTTVLSDTAARKYVQGVAWHCYGGDVSAQNTVHDAFPTKDTYFTECSGGEWATNWSDNLKWFVGTLIIGSVRDWSRAVALWNLALDENHGPHTGGCGNCRGVVTVVSSSGVYQRNVEYYALGHASKFVHPGAHRIGSSSGITGLESVAFKNADDGSIAVIVLNTAAQAQRFSLRAAGKSFRYTLPPAGVATFIWS
jgi:glucosylceramidase